MSTPQAAPGVRAVLSIPAFRRLWTAQVISVFGDFLAFYAVSSYISFRLHGTPAQVTMIMASFLAPFAVIGPVAGVFVDRWDAKRTMIASDLIRAALVLMLVFARVPWQFYAVFASLSTVSSFFVPAQTVTTPLIVPRESLMAASAAMQQAFQAVRLISPAVAGAMAGTLGEQSCFYADFASFAASALLIGSIAIPRERPHINKDLRSVIGELNSGLVYVLTHPVISFVVVALAAGTFAISAFGSLLAVYVRDVLHAGPAIFGSTGAMVGAGMLSGSVFIAPAARRMKHPTRLMLLGLLVEGLAATTLAATTQTALALVECALVGLGAALIIIPAGALLQSEPAPEMRGRVSGIWMALICAAQAIAVFFAGDVAARIGIVNLYYGCAVLMAIFAVTGWLRLRQLT